MKIKLVTPCCAREVKALWWTGNHKLDSKPRDRRCTACHDWWRVDTRALPQAREGVNMHEVTWTHIGKV